MGLKRSLSSETVGAPPPKKRAMPPSEPPPAAAAIVKTPATGASGGKAPGLMAKSLSTVPPEAAAAATVTQAGQSKSKAPVPLQAVGSVAKMRPIEKRPAVPTPTASPPAKSSSPPARDAETMPSAAAEDASMVIDFVGRLDATPAGAKLRHIVRLAEAMGQSLPVDHINHFLRALKKRIIDRAQSDGVRASAASAPPPPKAVVPPKASPGTLATANGKAVAKQPTGVVAKTPAVPFAKVASVVVPKAAVSVSGSLSVASPSDASEGAPASPPSDLQDDPLYVLVGELAGEPVMVDGSLREGRLLEVFKRLWDGVARKPKDWVAVWLAMGIPQECQDQALQKLLNLAFVQTEDPDRAPLIIAELVKAHRVKLRSVQDVLANFGQNLDGILAVNEDAWHVYAQLLVHVFPKPAASGWGWSRVGWSWQSWWQFAEKCVESIEPSKAFDVLGLILRIIQDREGQPLPQLPAWTDGDKLQRVLTKLCELGSCEQHEVVERLSLQGVVAE